MAAVAPDLAVSKCPFHGAAPDAALSPSGCPVSARAAAFDPFEDGYVHPPLVREPLILVLRNESLLQPDKPIALSRLDNLRLALPGKPNVIRTQIENAMERRGFEFKTIFEIDAMNLSIELARQGGVRHGDAMLRDKRE